MFFNMYLYLIPVLFVPALSSIAIENHEQKDNPVKDLQILRTEEDMLKLKTHQLECIDETHADPDLVLKVKSGDWKVNVPTLKNWVWCMLYRLGLMSKEGVYRLDEAFSKVSKEDENKVEKLIDECLTTKLLPPAEVAWEYVKCLHVKDPHGNFSSISVFKL